jgi:predicted TIM-barrel fold metal-dependent hydrolase
MTIITAHPSFPWQEEALAVANHKPNVYIDLSGSDRKGIYVLGVPDP